MTEKEFMEAPRFPVEFYLFNLFWERDFSQSGSEDFDDKKDEIRFKDRTWCLMYLFFCWLDGEDLHIWPKEDKSDLAYDLVLELADPIRINKRLKEEYKDVWIDMQHRLKESNKDEKEWKERFYECARMVNELKEELKKYKK